MKITQRSELPVTQGQIVSSFKKIAILGLIAAATFLTACAQNPKNLKVSSHGAATDDKYGYIYFFRGFGNIYSLGTDGLAEKLRIKGVTVNVYTHGNWPRAAEEIRAGYRQGKPKPVILAGHSLGANSALYAARELSRDGIPVAYVSTIDPTSRKNPSENIKLVSNFYADGISWGAPLEADNPRKTKVRNMDLKDHPEAKGIAHTEYDDLEYVHDVILSDIRRIIGR